VRKPRRLSPEELAPFSLELGRTRKRSKAPDTKAGPADVGCPAPTVEHPALAADPHTLSPLLDWPTLFGNANPVEIEVGMGKGLFLLTQATTRPDVNFFGIEIVRKYQLYAATRFAIRRLANIKTTCADALVILLDHVRVGSVSAVHVLFPDPWWKARHKKRRVFTPVFAAELARVIATGGRLHIASDVEEYFDVMTGIVGAMPAFRELSSETSRDSGDTAGYQTNFERKARLKGTPIWRATYERTTEAITIAADPAEKPPGAVAPGA